MTFRLITVLYLFALLAASLTVFGAWGALAAGLCCIFAVGHSRYDGGQKIIWSVWVAAFVILAVASLIQMSQHRQPYSSVLKSISANNVKQLILALLNYESTHGHFPPACITDDQGNPLYSWRVELLPYLDQVRTYELLHLDEPWDSEHNRPLLDQVDASLFASPRLSPDVWNSHKANYLAVVDEESAWPPASSIGASDISHERMNTVMLVEVGGLDIHWAEPRDLTMEEAVEILVGTPPQKFEVEQPGYFVSKKLLLKNRLAGFVDGQLDVLPPLSDRATARAYLTRAGGEPLAEVEHPGPGPSFQVVKTIVHWNHVWGVTVWLALVLLPSVPATRRRIWPSRKEAEVEEQEATEEAEEILEH